MSNALEGELAAQVADMLFERGVIKFAGVGNSPAEGFRLKLHDTNPDAPLSPIYLNIRSEGHKGGTLREEDFDLIADFLADVLARFGCKFNYICGIPVAGEPIADALERRLRQTQSPLRRLRLDKEEKDGKRRIIYSDETVIIHRGEDCVLLVDDLITQAGTKLEAIGLCEFLGLEVEGILVLVDREQGGTDQVEEAGHTVIAGFLLSELLEHYVETGKVSREKANEVNRYVAESRI